MRGQVSSECSTSLGQRLWSWHFDLGNALSRTPEEHLPDLRDDDDRQRDSQAYQPLLDVEAGGVEEFLERPEDCGQDDREHMA